MGKSIRKFGCLKRAASAAPEALPSLRSKSNICNLQVPAGVSFGNSSLIISLSIIHINSALSKFRQSSAKFRRFKTKEQKHNLAYFHLHKLTLLFQSELFVHQIEAHFSITKSIHSKNNFYHLFSIFLRYCQFDIFYWEHFHFSYNFLRYFRSQKFVPGFGPAIYISQT